MQLQMFSAWFNLRDRAEQVHSQVWLIVEVFKKTVKIIGRNWSAQLWAMTGQIDQLEQGPDLHLLMIKTWSFIEDQKWSNIDDQSMIIYWRPRHDQLLMIKTWSLIDDQNQTAPCPPLGIKTINWRFVLKLKNDISELASKNKIAMILGMMMMMVFMLS